MKNKRKKICIKKKERSQTNKESEVFLCLILEQI